MSTDIFLALLLAVSVIGDAGTLQPDTELAISTGALPSSRKAGWVHIPKAGTTFLTTVAHWLDEEHWLPPSAGIPACDFASQGSSSPCFGAGFGDEGTHGDQMLEETFATQCANMRQNRPPMHGTVGLALLPLSACACFG